jgi:hypothetical protein
MPCCRLVMRAPRLRLVLVMKTFVIRCGTLDCDWGHKMRDLGQDQLQLCYFEFRKHCIQRHDLQEWDMTSLMHFDLEPWMLTLIKT